MRRRGVTLVEVLVGMAVGCLALALVYGLVSGMTRTGERVEARDRESLARMIVGQSLRWDLVQARGVEWTTSDKTLKILRGEESHIYEARDGALLRDGRILTLPVPCTIELAPPGEAGFPVVITFASGEKVEIVLPVPRPPRSRARWVSLLAR